MTWPALNALLNAASAILLSLGFYFIHRKRIQAHHRCMLSAFMVSLLFLISYLGYHYTAGSTRFAGQGWIRSLYFTILLSHTILAVVIVPMVFLTLRHALTGRFLRHQALARWTWPLWMYVSVTGVVIYLLLYQIYVPGNVQ